MAETQKHTPGPWLVGGPYPGTSVCIEVDPGRGGPYPEPPVWEPICILDQRTEGEPNPQAVANAHLISAAPDMEKALLFALEHVRELREAWRTGALSERDGRGGERSNRNVEVESVLSAALAKAVGAVQ